jgi:hypothetical protein
MQEIQNSLLWKQCSVKPVINPEQPPGQEAVLFENKLPIDL